MLGRYGCSRGHAHSNLAVLITVEDFATRPESKDTTLVERWVAVYTRGAGGRCWQYFSYLPIPRTALRRIGSL